MLVRDDSEFDEMYNFIVSTDEECLDEDEIDELNEWSYDEWDNYEE